MKDVKERAVQIAKSLLDSNEYYLEKVIELWRIGNSMYGEVWNTEFHIFGVIESDTDHLPTEKVRKHCSEDWLAKTDQEIQECIVFYNNEIVTACNEIVAKHENA